VTKSVIKTAITDLIISDGKMQRRIKEKFFHPTTPSVTRDVLSGGRFSKGKGFAEDREVQAPHGVCLPVVRGRQGELLVA